ncbi:hypothetical protein D3C85_1273000 [compost metagenome]
MVMANHEVALVVRCIHEDRARWLVLEHHRTQRGVYPPVLCPLPTLAAAVREQNVPVRLQVLHRDTVRLRLAEVHTAVVRVAHQLVRELLGQLS